MENIERVLRERIEDPKTIQIAFDIFRKQRNENPTSPALTRFILESINVAFTNESNGDENNGSHD